MGDLDFFEAQEEVLTIRELDGERLISFPSVSGAFGRLHYRNIGRLRQEETVQSVWLIISEGNSWSRTDYYIPNSCLCRCR